MLDATDGTTIIKAGHDLHVFNERSLLVKDLALRKEDFERLEEMAEGNPGATVGQMVRRAIQAGAQ